MLPFLVRYGRVSPCIFFTRFLLCFDNNKNRLGLQYRFLMNNAQIGRVISTLERLAGDWNLPSVSEVASKGMDPFKVLISTLLSLRTKDAVTSAAAHRLFALATTPHAMLDLPAQKVQRAIYPVAFYRNKTRTIQDTCRRLIKEFGGQVPADLETLCTFRGVGRKTANLVLILGYGIPAMCVDTHVHRISNRLGYIQTRTPDDSESALRKKLSKKHWIRYNDLMVAFGQNLCKPVSPHCSLCPFEGRCPKIGVGKHR